MANMPVRDASGSTVYTRASGAGTDVSPYIPSPAATIADGSDVNAGATTDAAVSAGATGTLAAKIRRISTDIGTILTNWTTILGYFFAEDAQHTTGDKGVMSLGVVKTTPTATSVTDTDYAPPIMSPAGQWVAPLPAPLPVNGTTGETRNSSLSSAVTLTPPSGATHVILQATVSGKNVRLTLDGTVPTSTVGFVIVALDPPIRVAVSGHTLKVIEESASATLEIMWEGN